MAPAATILAGCTASGSPLRRRRGGTGREEGAAGGGGVAARVAQMERRGFRDTKVDSLDHIIEASACILACCM